MLHRWKTTRALEKYFGFRIRGGPSGQPARVLRSLYSDRPDFDQCSPVMAAAIYVITYGVQLQDASLGERLDTVFPRLMAQGHLSPYQLEVLLAYGDDLTSQLATAA